MGITIIDTDGGYMQITSKRIKIGNNAHGVITDSPFKWERHKFSNNPVINGYLLAYDDSPSFKKHLMPYLIRNDTLVVGDMMDDGVICSYTKH